MRKRKTQKEDRLATTELCITRDDVFRRDFNPLAYNARRWPSSHHAGSVPYRELSVVARSVGIRLEAKALIPKGGRLVSRAFEANLQKFYGCSTPGYEPLVFLHLFTIVIVAFPSSSISFTLIVVSVISSCVNHAARSVLSCAILAILLLPILQIRRQEFTATPIRSQGAAIWCGRSSSAVERC